VLFFCNIAGISCRLDGVLLVNCFPILVLLLKFWTSESSKQGNSVADNFTIEQLFLASG
jgi:hypothetical protein